MVFYLYKSFNTTCELTTILVKVKNAQCCFISILMWNLTLEVIFRGLIYKDSLDKMHAVLDRFVRIKFKLNFFIRCFPFFL